MRSLACKWPKDSQSPIYLGREVGALPSTSCQALSSKVGVMGQYLGQQPGRRSGHGGKLAGLGLLYRIATQPAADEGRGFQATYEALLELR